MSWFRCVRFSVISIIILTAIGLFISYRFDMDVNLVVNFVQQYSFKNRSPQTQRTSSTKPIVGDRKQNDSNSGSTYAEAPTPMVKGEPEASTLRNDASVRQQLTNLTKPESFNSNGTKIDSEFVNQTESINRSNASGANSSTQNRKVLSTESFPPTSTSASNKTGNGTTAAVCNFPQLLVDDPLIRPYLKHYGPLECSTEKNWVYTGDGRFYIDADAVRRHGNIKCKYWRYDRIDEDYFNEVALGVYPNGTLLDGDAFYAQCKAADGSQYDNVQAGVPLPRQELLDRIEKAHRKRKGNPKKKGLDLNVFIYLMDSVSRINFIRKLPNFYKYLTETMDAYVMEGFNIVGDGTPWAVIPMLTGHFQTELSEARKRFDNATFVDKWPFVFKNFTDAGYVTSYAEEQPWFSAFTYKLKGFDRQPVDHYLRTMLTAVEKYKGQHKSYCLGDTPRSLVWLQFWRELQSVYRPLGVGQFSMMFSSETSHDDYNYVQSLDDHWTREFGKLYEENFLNDTILIIMGDHGRRFGAVRQTQTGKLEEKLPFLAVVTPPWFRKHYPMSDANLRKNQNRLVTVFDLYATYIHLLNFREDGGIGNRSNRGISLFKEIPPERTCAHAHIKAHFCSCLDWIEEHDLTNKIVLSAANRVINYFNKQLLEVSGRCANLTLGKMISARLLKPNSRLLAFKESLDYDNYTPNLSADTELHSVLYQIRFTTEPGGGDWEASLTYFLKLDSFGMSYDDISRLNEYNEQAQCVINTHQHLRTFCYCLK